MGRRGEALADHILFTAKDVFLELGFERASMDAVAARANTSKRTLYAHFESKENLYIAVVAFVRELYLDKLKAPSDYGGDPREAAARFCARFLELMLWPPSVRMSRLVIAEAERFPTGSADFYDAIFTTAAERLANHLRVTLHVAPKIAVEAANDLIGQVLHPRFHRALFGVDAIPDTHHETPAVAIDVRPIRKAVNALFGGEPPPAKSGDALSPRTSAHGAQRPG